MKEEDTLDTLKLIIFFNKYFLFKDKGRFLWPHDQSSCVLLVSHSVKNVAILTGTLLHLSFSS